MQAKVRRGGLPWSRPSSIIAAYAQTEPGMYLPSWPTNITRPAVLSGSGEPSPASTRRQASSMQSCPASTAASAPAMDQGDSRASAAVVSVQFRARP